MFQRRNFMANAASVKWLKMERAGSKLRLEPCPQRSIINGKLVQSFCHWRFTNRRYPWPPASPLTSLERLGKHHMRGDREKPTFLAWLWRSQEMNCVLMNNSPFFVYNKIIFKQYSHGVSDSMKLSVWPPDLLECGFLLSSSQLQFYSRFQSHRHTGWGRLQWSRDEPAQNQSSLH